MILVKGCSWLYIYPRLKASFMANSLCLEKVFRSKQAVCGSAQKGGKPSLLASWTSWVNPGAQLEEGCMSSRLFSLVGQLGQRSEQADEWIGFYEKGDTIWLTLESIISLFICPLFQFSLLCVCVQWRETDFCLLFWKYKKIIIAQNSPFSSSCVKNSFPLFCLPCLLL